MSSYRVAEFFDNENLISGIFALRASAEAIMAIKVGAACHALCCTLFKTFSLVICRPWRIRCRYLLSY